MGAAVLFVGFDANPAMAMLGAMRDRGENLAPVMVDIGSVALAQVGRAFASGTAPDGTPWEPLKSRQGQILVDKGILRNSVGLASGRDFAEVGVGVGTAAGAAAIYAAIHQFGGKTRARVLKPVNKQALFWPGARHPVRSVKHPGADIPARPYVPDEQSLDWEQIGSLIRIYMTEAANAARH